VARAGRGDVAVAASAAHKAFRDGLPAYRRAEILDRSADLISERSDELAWLVCREVAKPISLARTEVERAIATFRFASAEARTLAGREIPLDAAGNGMRKLAFTQRMPVGVVGAITPFNFPVNLVAHKLAPAIAAGCPVVLKPAPQAPLCALALARVVADAGLPDGWLSVLPGRPEEVGAAIVEHPAIEVLSFTGSARVGWEIAARAPRKRTLLELGGSAPAIVSEDVDLGRAAHRLAENAFSFAGQSCVSVQRVYVHERVRDAFLERFLERASALGVGSPEDPEVVCGPVIDASALSRIGSWIEEARNGGARLLLGGDVAEGIMSPTVLVDVPEDARLIQAEAFAPVVSVNQFARLEDALARANGTPFALQAAIFTQSLDAALTALADLRFGAVLINEAPTFRADHMPYGGRGDSGNTREGPSAAVRELTEERLVIFELPHMEGDP
jgi:acyl-CoA reductase-like NAD-dependent aldehyde dehydrogenase